MIPSDSRQKIEYQCNKCHKIRLMLIPPALRKEKVDLQGYVEYIDVHICTEKKLVANALFVDVSYSVRSQVVLDSPIDKKEEKEQIKDIFSIPTPKKTELRVKKIEPTADFGAFNLRKIKIKDSLRNCVCVIGLKEEGKTITVNSPMGFIEIEALYCEELEETVTKKWLETLSKYLESLEFLDENIYRYIPTYLDYWLSYEPVDREILELDLLLHLTTSLPISKLSQEDLQGIQWKTIFPNKPVNNHRIYNSILRLCENNEKMTLLEVYEEILNSLSQMLSLPFYISAVRDLIANDFLEVEKLEFVTVYDPYLV